METSSSVHEYHTHKVHAILQITHSVCHGIALAFIFYFRISFLLLHHPHFLAWVLLFIAEVLMSFIWLLKQPFYWWPVTRTVSPENLLPKQQQQQLPGIDVFICTADPNREPTFEVMNTVISAMALEYPPHKLSVYLSDDANAAVTLYAIKQAWVFATWWLPFVTKYNIKTVCPRAYFEQNHLKDNSHPSSDDDFIQDRNIIQAWVFATWWLPFVTKYNIKTVCPRAYFEQNHLKEDLDEDAHNTDDFIHDSKLVQEKYEVFKLRVKSKASLNSRSKTSVEGHPAFIQVIDENAIEEGSAKISRENVQMPSLVYVSREKTPSHPHHFKAGALNVLLRISATMSHSPYILVLDCDMYCNDSISAREAMCFYLDPKISPTLGWVQYPQTYHNINENDIYDSQMRQGWEVIWPGADGLQGPVISGTNFYINRKALYGFDLYNGNDIKGVKDVFGISHELFIKSKINGIPKELSSVSVQEALSLASCAYEENTKWGQEVGFRYKSVVEDVMTGFMLQRKGWRSVYINPSKRAAFLGSATTNLNEMLIQNSRWASGLLEIGLSKYCPLLCNPSAMQFLHKLSSSWVVLFPLACIPLWCFVSIPPIAFLYGIPLYPKVSDPFLLAYAYIFISILLKMLYEVGTTRNGGLISILSIVLNEERSWMIKSLTCYFYGIFDCLMAKFGLREASFIPTNKSSDHNDITRSLYEMGKYDFRTSNMFLVPLVTMVSMNICCFVGGVARITNIGDFDVMFAQAFFSIYVFVIGFPIIKAMFLRRDTGCIPLLVTLESTIFSALLLIFGYLLLIY